MKTQHWALLAAAAFLYYMTTQRTNVAIAQPGNKPNTGFGPFDPGSPGGWDNTFEPLPSPIYDYNATRKQPWTVGGYEGGMNWPARDNIFG
jgi:hypothetical protein